MLRTALAVAAALLVKALAAWSGAVLSTLAGWPPADAPSGISLRDRERVNFQHATIDGYFSERITGLFAR